MKPKPRESEAHQRNNLAPNPTVLLQPAILMLRHLDETAAAGKAQTVLETAYAERKTFTRGVGGSA